MPSSAGAAEAVLAEAEEVVRRAGEREEAGQRRRDRRERKRRRREAERERKAAQRRGRERAEEERLRVSADEARRVLLRRAAALREACGGSIADCFAAVPDPRDPRGRGIRHPLPCILALVVMAMLHGKTKLAGILAWIAHADQDMLAAAGARTGRDGRRQAPCGRTVTRVLGLLGAQALADAVACYLAAAVTVPAPVFPVAGPVPQPSLNCDGKQVRGAVRPDGTSPFLLSAAAGGIVVAEREIGVKTNEIPGIGPLLRDLNERFPLAGWILTADALHTNPGFFTLACEELHAHAVLTVKGNQPNLYDALQQLCWAGARRHRTKDKGHGRTETRTHLVMDAPEEIKERFPHVRQVAKVIRTRTVTWRKGNGKTRERVTETSTETVYLITSLTAREAGPEHIAAYIRNHWGIENKVHLVRDVTLREDASKVSAGSRPRALATLRNLLMGLIRQADHDDIAATIREAEYDNDLLLAILRLTTAP
jgi:predicted transposase YbfD/YdcC